MHPVDQHVGKKIRKRRQELNLLQEDLAAPLGLSTQQIHKYETGVNRVSASRLFEIGKILDVKICYFFPLTETEDNRDDLATSINCLIGCDRSDERTTDQLKRIELAFRHIKKDSLREGIVTMIETMSSEYNGLI